MTDCKTPGQIAYDTLMEDYFFPAGHPAGRYPYDELPEAGRDAWEQVATAVRADLDAKVEELQSVIRMLSEPEREAVEYIQHVKSGGWYEVVTRDAQVQTDTPLADYAFVAVYRNVITGATWVRPLSEMDDGRFKPAPAALAPNPTETEAGRGVIPTGFRLIPEKLSPEMFKIINYAISKVDEDAIATSREHIRKYGGLLAYTTSYAKQVYEAIIANLPTPTVSPTPDPHENIGSSPGFIPGTNTFSGGWQRLPEGAEPHPIWTDEGHGTTTFKATPDSTEPAGAPGLDWKLSDETKSELRDIDVAIATAGPRLAALTPSAPIAAPVRENGGWGVLDVMQPSPTPASDVLGEAQTPSVPASRKGR